MQNLQRVEFICWIISSHLFDLFFHYVSFHWQVLFPLLENVQKLSSTASNVKDEAATGNILIHHSRDTAEKQWAETCVLSLAGVARTFNAKRKVLQTIGKATVVKDISTVAGFDNWILLNQYIGISVLLQIIHVLDTDFFIVFCKCIIFGMTMYDI